jgi:hypothetical protein
MEGKMMAKPVTFKVLAHDIALVLPCRFDQTDNSLNGQADWESEQIRVANRASSGTKHSFNKVLGTLFHELCHIWSQASGHCIFESDGDDETEAKKEQMLNGFAELMTQTLLESGMLNPEWLDKVADLADG